MNRRDGLNSRAMNLLGLSTSQLEDALKAHGQSAFRGRQIADWIYRKGAMNFEAMTNLSRELRDALNAEYSLDFPHVAARHESSDGSAKLLLELNDGERVETVRLPYKDRVSVCVSSQAGCAMACAFCATGLGGFRRNLSTAEIVAQPLLAMREGSPPAHTPSHIVFMGMGEPLLNVQNVLPAIGLLHDEMGIAMRHITVSTVGIIAGIEKLAAQKWQLTLAVSLHAPDDELRHQLIPTSRKTRVSGIVNAAKKYAQTTGRRVTFEYVVLGGVNDDATRAQQLAELCKGWPCHVNLIPWNAVPDAKWEGAVFHAPSQNNLHHFRAILEESGITVTQRVQRGNDVAAACGQLRAIEKIGPSIPVL
jgi:23S rRNA (adenine2503-C2)-methyltransferase